MSGLNSRSMAKSKHRQKKQTAKAWRKRSNVARYNEKKAARDRKQKKEIGHLQSLKEEAERKRNYEKKLAARRYKNPILNALRRRNKDD